MSLRKIAKELGVSHTLLVLCRQGKRSISPALEARYNELMTAGGYKSGYNSDMQVAGEPVNNGVVGHPGIEPGTSVLSGLRSNQLS